WKLVNMTLGQDRLLWLLFIVSAVTTAWTEREIIWLFLLCGIITLFIKSPPKTNTASAIMFFAEFPQWLTLGMQGTASSSTLWQILWYFAEAGAFVFGSGLAIVPFLYGGVVEHYHWLNERQFLDAVAVAMITPGPVVITVAFIGYLVGGPIGATLA